MMKLDSSQFFSNRDPMRWEKRWPYNTNTHLLRTWHDRLHLFNTNFRCNFLCRGFNLDQYIMQKRYIQEILVLKEKQLSFLRWSSVITSLSWKLHTPTQINTRDSSKPKHYPCIQNVCVPCALNTNVISHTPITITAVESSSLSLENCQQLR